MVDSSPLGSRVSLSVAGALRTLRAPETFSRVRRDISVRPRAAKPIDLTGTTHLKRLRHPG